MMLKLVLVVFAAVLAVESATMVGAPQEIDTNDAGALSALKAAVAHYNRGNNDMFLRQVAEVVSVKRQVVAGFKYIITVKMVKTSCRKDSPTEGCGNPQDPENTQNYQCSFTVVTRPWQNITEVMSHTC